MKILPYRVLRNRPGEFEETLASEGTVILEKNGEQIALVLDATKQTIESLVRLASQVKALAALSEFADSPGSEGSISYPRRKSERKSRLFGRLTGVSVL